MKVGPYAYTHTVQPYMYGLDATYFHDNILSLETCIVEHVSFMPLLKKLKAVLN